MTVNLPRQVHTETTQDPFLLHTATMQSPFLLHTASYNDELGLLHKL